MFHKDKDTLNLLSSYALRNEKKTDGKEKVIYRDIGKIHIKKEEKENFWRYFLPIIALIIFIGIFNAKQNEIEKNPILGKWRNTSALGVIEIEFKKNTASALGLIEEVKYEIGENQIMVFETKNKVGVIYKIHNKDTIYTDIFGTRSIYKRVIE